MSKKWLFPFVFLGAIFANPVSLTISDQNGKALVQLSGEGSQDNLDEALFLEDIDMVFSQGEKNLNLNASSGFWNREDDKFFLNDVFMSSPLGFNLSADSLSLDVLEGKAYADSSFEIDYGHVFISGIGLSIEIDALSGSNDKSGMVTLRE